MNATFPAKGNAGAGWNQTMLRLLAFAVALVAPRLLPKDLTDHDRFCNSAFKLPLLLSFRFLVGLAILYVAFANQIPDLVTKGKHLIETCPEYAKDVFDRPNGH